MKQRFACGEAENRIPEKFKHFIVTAERGLPKRTARCTLRRFYFSRLRAMSQSLLQEFAALEGMPEDLFQRDDFS